jgi:hypothetical protein
VADEKLTSISQEFGTFNHDLNRDSIFSWTESTVVHEDVGYGWTDQDLLFGNEMCTKLTGNDEFSRSLFKKGLRRMHLYISPEP